MNIISYHHHHQVSKNICEAHYKQKSQLTRCWSHSDPNKYVLNARRNWRRVRSTHSQFWTYFRGSYHFCWRPAYSPQVRSVTFIFNWLLSYMLRMINYCYQFIVSAFRSNEQKQLWDHHHQEHAPSWSVAVSTVRFHRSRSWARCQADTKPMLSGRKSCSMVQSQVRRGRPGGRFQSRGSPEIMDRRARVWSILLSALAIWPKQRRRLSRRVVDSCVWHVRWSTSTFVTWRR